MRAAWEFFDEGNGVASMDELAQSIARYRKARPDAGASIGCVLLRDLFFLSPEETLAAPSDFAKNIVRFKGYDLLGGGAHVDLMFETMLRRAEIQVDDEAGAPTTVPGRSSDASAW